MTLFPVGPTPSADACLVGALLYSTSSDAAAVLHLALDDDIESPALATVLGAVRRLVTNGSAHGPQLVLSELQRTGELHRHGGVAGQLTIAATSGVVPEAARDYAVAVVAKSLRRRVESYGTALVSAAVSASEEELRALVDAAGRGIDDIIGRLTRLRGETR